MVTKKGKFDELMKGRGSGYRGTDELPEKHTSTSGKPNGKRSDTEYKQVSAYIRKDTHRMAKIALLEEDRQFSELVEELLNTWLKSRT